MTSASSNKVINCGHKRVRRLFKKCLHSIFKKIVDIQVSNEIESPMHSSLSKRYCHFGTVDIILKHMSRKFSIVLRDGGWVGYHNCQIHFTRPTVDHVASGQ